MKISFNAIKWYGYEDLFKIPTEQLVDKIGAQLGALEEEPDYLGAKYDGIVVAKVVSCDDHPNADKLHVCMIDDGGVVADVPRNDQGLVQVVCGAPNVRAGMTVAWLPPKSTVPASVGKDPFVLEARELRGVVSNGMLASASELAITDDHSGLLEIKEDEVGAELIKPGTPFKNLYGLDDVIIDIENKMFTHRPDCFGLLGVGREIAGIQGLPFVSPDWYKTDAEIPAAQNTSMTISLANELPEEAKRFVLVPMDTVSVKPSPVWLQSFLSRQGVRSINNVVDITNYYMLLTGQPTHAYDYDKLLKLDGADTASIVIRNPHTDETINLLNGKTIAPRAEAIMIASAKTLIGLGGVMGGADSEVDENTTRIVLEVGSFDMYSVRRTAMAHGTFTDAVTRFNKGQSPLQNRAVAAKAIQELHDLAGAQVAGNVIDQNWLDSSVVERNALHLPVKVTAEFINARLGLSLSSNEVKTLLTNVEFSVEVQGDELTITAPFWRTDIEQREDIVEEVGRLYGFDHLPLNLPTRDLTPAAKNGLLSAKATIRTKLAKAGANEVLTYTFVHGDLLQKVGQDKDKAFQLSNALSPDLQYYRMSLVPSLLEKVHQNIKAGYDEFALFELGKTHSLDHDQDEDGLPDDRDMTALVVAANDKLKKQGAAYYQARIYVENLLGVELSYRSLTDAELALSEAQPFVANRSAIVSVKGGPDLGIIGEFKQSVAKALKLPAYCAGFEIDTEVLGKILHDKNEYQALPRFPKTVQDITLKVASDQSFQELDAFLWKQLWNARPDQSWMTLTPVSIYQKDDDTAHKQITLRLTIANYQRTLTDKEVNALLDTAAQSANETFNAERI